MRASWRLWMWKLGSVAVVALILISGNLLFAQDEVISFNSFSGIRGVAVTPVAYTAGEFRGDIAIFEGLRGGRDILVFNYGVAENVEIGIQSDIPASVGSKLSFFFKVRANEQGECLGFRARFVPVMAFGMGEFGVFAVASYRLRRTFITVGYNFSDICHSMFGNMNIQIGG